MDRFQQLLYDLSDLLQVTLYAEHNEKCRISINEELEIQLEYNSAKEQILIGCLCCEIPPGKFRENTLKEALKANGQFPRIGTYGYCAKSNKLALFHYLSIQHLTSEKFADLLAQFIDRAEVTKNGITKGNLTALSEVSSNKDKTAFLL